MKELLFAIRCINDHELFWSNDWGWVDDGFTIFSAKEIKKFHLPIEGEWVDYYDLEPIKVTHLTTPYFMDVIKGERNG